MDSSWDEAKKKAARLMGKPANPRPESAKTSTVDAAPAPRPSRPAPAQRLTRIEARPAPAPRPIAPQAVLKDLRAAFNSATRLAKQLAAEPAVAKPIGVGVLAAAAVLAFKSWNQPEQQPPQPLLFHRRIRRTR